MKKISCIALSASVILVAGGLAQASGSHHDSEKKEHHDSKKGHHGAHWGYDGMGSPAHWGSLKEDYALCGTGKSQSPIDITSSLAADLPEIQFNYKDSSLEVVNNGHTIQANYDAGSYIEIAGKRYDLLQFHFHTPSEHTINGAPADMVAHLVHKSPDDGQLAVVGVLFNQGNENAALNPIWENMPKEKGKFDADSVKINAADLLPANKAYYNYSGSLTTPPCSEGVNWNVLATNVSASEAQVHAFGSIFEKSARPVQGLNDRTVNFGL